MTVSETLAQRVLRDFRALRWIVGGITVALFTLGVIVTVKFEIDRVEHDLSRWLGVHRGALEEALFLNNAPAIDIRMSEAGSSVSPFAHVRAAVQSVNGGTQWGNRDLFRTGDRSWVGHAIGLQYRDHLSYAGNDVGVLAIDARLRASSLLLVIGPIAGVCLLLFLGLMSSFQRFLSGLDYSILKPMTELRDMMKSFSGVPSERDKKPDMVNHPAEVRELFGGFQQLTERIAAYAEQEVRQAEIATRVRVAAQVAHDIQSPLAALTMATEDLNEVSEKRRELIRKALDRIETITHDLSKEVSAANFAVKHSLGTEELVAEPVRPMLERVVTEKRYQFRHEKDIRIDLSREGYGAFIRCRPSEVQRVIANVIQNGVEAMRGRSGNISLALEQTATLVTLRVTDNGCGIPSHILKHVSEDGFSYGKAGGSGLGLSHARRVMESLRGQLRIESAEGKGTTVFLELPIEPPPVWFLSEIRLSSGADVAVVDDDETIHAMWRTKISENGITLHFFRRPSEVPPWLRSYRGKLPPTFLVDQEFRGEKETGLQLIEKLALRDQSILVTNSHEQGDIRNRCVSLGVRLLPKSELNSVPLRIV